jgi:hypothetical protein
VERVRQGGEFVAALLDRVIGLLLKSLQAELAVSAPLRADLGLPDVFPAPVRGGAHPAGFSMGPVGFYMGKMLSACLARRALIAWRWATRDKRMPAAAFRAGSRASAGFAELAGLPLSAFVLR